jgi:hypothetical protein
MGYKLEANVEGKLKCAWNIGRSRIANPAKIRIQQVLTYPAVLEVTKMQELPTGAHVRAVGPHTRPAREEVGLGCASDGVDRKTQSSQ